MNFVSSWQKEWSLILRIKIFTYPNGHDPVPVEKDDVMTLERYESWPPRRNSPVAIRGIYVATVSCVLDVKLIKNCLISRN